MSEIVHHEHPGQLLAAAMRRRGLSTYALGKAIGVPANRIGGILHGRRAITAETAVLLAACFHSEPDCGDPLYWLGRQAEHDVAAIRQRR